MASLVISIGIQMVLPFPYGLGVALALFIAFPFFLRRRYMGRTSGYGGSMFGMGSNPEQQTRPIKYVCLVCNNQHKSSECPRCGSKMKRADF
ncbi:MAG: putative membrane protein [Cenarchaeum symbiont of Oopsacas minuta]|nr:putative membrane protein [Cenarchaeum symbiont of Oopsacas minuta]